MPSFLPRRAPLLAALATLAACACSNGNSASSAENLEDGGVASDAGPSAGGSGAGGRGTNGGAGGAGGDTGPSAGGTPPGLDADGGEAVPPAPGPDAGECGPFDCASACADLAWPIGVDLVTVASRPIGNILAVAGCGFVGIHRASLSGLPLLFTWYDAETGEMVGRGCEGRSPEAGCTLTSCLPYETGGCTHAELGLEDAADDG